MERVPVKNRRIITRAVFVFVFACILSVSHSFPQRTGSQPQDPISLKASQLLETGNFAEAESLLRNHLAKIPNDYRAKNLLGVSLDQQGRMAEAENVYREILKSSPRDVSAMANLGVLMAKSNRTDEAVKMLDGALRVQPSHPQANYNLAAIYSARGEFAKSLPMLERLSGITAASKTPKTKDVSLLFSLMKAYAAAGKAKQATQTASLLEKQQPNDPRLLFTIGIAFASAGQYREAAAFFEKVRAKIPPNYDVLYNLGIAYYNLDELDKSRAVLQEALNINPVSAEVFYRLGLVAQAKNEDENAVGLWLKAIELKPDFHEPNFLIAEALYKRQAYQGANDFYEKAANLANGNLLYQIRLTVNYIKLQQYEKARKVLDAEQKKNPNDLSLLYLRGYLGRAEGTYDEAIAAFEKILTMSPNNPDALANLGFLAYERADNVKAEKLLREAMRINPKSYAAHYDLGRLLLRLKRFDEAISVLEKGAELSKSDPGIRYQLFIAYSRAKQKAKADAAFAEFKRLEREFNGATGSATSGDRKQEIPSNIGEKKP